MGFNSGFKGLNETQHVSGDTPPIIRSLKLHKRPLVLHTWKVVGRAVVGSCRIFHCKNRNMMNGSTNVNFIVSEPFKRQLNPICNRLALLGAHHILHVSKIRVKLKMFLNNRHKIQR